MQKCSARVEFPSSTKVLFHLLFVCQCTVFSVIIFRCLLGDSGIQVLSMMSKSQPVVSRTNMIFRASSVSIEVVPEDTEDLKTDN